MIATKNYVDSVMAMSINYGMINPCDEVQLPSGSQYFSRANRDRLSELLQNVSEDDARELLQAVFNEISKDNRTVRLGKRIETAILQFMVENAS